MALYDFIYCVGLLLDNIFIPHLALMNNLYLRLLLSLKIVPKSSSVM